MLFNHSLEVVVVITLVNQHQSHLIRRIQVPILEPRPEAEIAVDMFYLIIVGTAFKERAYLLSGLSFKASAALSILS